MTKDNANQTEPILFYEFDAALGAVTAEVDRVLSTSPALIRGYMSHLALAKGKFIRAASLLACAQNGDDLIHPDAVRFAAAVELLHLATLVHDDVIDDADIRRGVATLQKKYGRRTAVICGDFLLCAALKTAASVPNKTDYSEFTLPNYISRVCLGELDQHINNRNLDLTVYHYLKIIGGKTAALFEGSFYAGAVLCTGDEHCRRRFARLGRYIGMIFQLTDDCIDFEMDENAAKKPVQSDFEQGVITLPLIHALRGEAALRQKAEEGGITREEINRAVRRTGGLIFAGTISKRYYGKAERLMNELELSQAKRERLSAILDKAYYGLKK